VILDSSALIALLWQEPEAPRMEELLADAEAIAVSAPTLLEAAVVAEGRFGPAMGAKLDELVRRLEPEVVAFTHEHLTLAREGWRRYGKGRHPAGLNLGDCFAYALARTRDQPLLFKGDDFAQTDVKAAL
jgi:ribonuclease VapC